MSVSSQLVRLTDLTSVSEARRAAQRVGGALGFDEVKLGEAAILTTEAARNAVVHGKGGQMLLSGFQSGAGARMEILALDSGPGILDLPRALQDGYSTGSTPGTGLGAISRMANTFDIYSSIGGTAVLAEMIQQPSPQRLLLDFSGFAIPLQGEQACGDAIDWSYADDRLALVMVDGLGHGFHAAEAAEEAVTIFHKYCAEPPREILARMHDALKKTRGAAAAVAEIRPLAGSLIYAGIGNISAVLLSGTINRSIISHSGTLGHVVGRIQEFKLDWPRDGMLVMHSDGLHTRWDLSRYPGLTARNPTIIAGVLFRDFRRERDDTSVLVVKTRSRAL